MWGGGNQTTFNAILMLPTGAASDLIPPLHVDQCMASSGISNSATMLMILISGLIAGPAVSL